MTRPLLITAVCASLLACGPKEAASTAATAQAQAMHDGVPADGTSQTFAKKLTGLEISNFKPEDTGSLKLTYVSMTFKTDGSWSAEASMIDPFDETTPCKEGGTWAMDTAEAATEATVTWKVLETNCIARSEGGEIRAKLVIGKGGSIEAFNR